MSADIPGGGDHLTGRANASRIYDALIGGNALTEIDESPLRTLLSINPGTPAVARENRDFMLRACRLLAAELGVTQFLDLGCGFPTPHSPNLHQVVTAVRPEARGVYVDREQDAVDRWRALLGDDSTFTATTGRVQDPKGVLTDSAVTATLDFDRPVAVVLTGVLPFVPTEDDPWGRIAQFRDATAGGSYLVLSHALTSEDWPEGAEQVLSMYRQEIQPMFPRREQDVRRFFDGYTLLEPGLVSTPAWRPDVEVDPGVLAYKRAVAGVGRKD